MANEAAEMNQIDHANDHQLMDESEVSGSESFEGRRRSEDDELEGELEFGSLADEDGDDHSDDDGDDDDDDEDDDYDVDSEDDEELKPRKSAVVARQVSMEDLEEEERTHHDDEVDEDSDEETVTLSAKTGASPFDEEVTWTRKKGRTVLVGVTETALISVGSVESIDFPAVGDELGEDDVLLEIHGDEGDLVLTSPVSGRILELNPILVEEPQLLSDDPMDEGWLLRIYPE